MPALSHTEFGRALLNQVKIISPATIPRRLPDRMRSVFINGVEEWIASVVEIVLYKLCNAQSLGCL